MMVAVVGEGLETKGVAWVEVAREGGWGAEWAGGGDGDEGLCEVRKEKLGGGVKVFYSCFARVRNTRKKSIKSTV